MKHWILGALMVAAASAAAILTPHQRLAAQYPISLEREIPGQFGDWTQVKDTVQVVESPQLQAGLKSIYAQVLAREYASRDGTRVMLSIAYTEDQSENSGKQSHRPEICYPAQGFRIQDRQRTTLQTTYGDIPVKQMTAIRDERQEPLTYWSTIGTHVASNDVEAKLTQLRYGFSGTVPDGVVFRVSSISTDGPSAFAQQARFVAALAQALAPATRVRMMGIPPAQGRV